MSNLSSIDVKVSWSMKPTTSTSFATFDTDGLGVVSAKTNVAFDVFFDTQLEKAIKAIEKIQAEFNSAQKGKKKVSFADLVVLAQNYIFSSPSIGWAQGDFDGNSAVNFALPCVTVSA